MSEEVKPSLTLVIAKWPDGRVEVQPIGENVNVVDLLGLAHHGVLWCEKAWDEFSTPKIKVVK
jgi:hypothetical protein